MRLERLIFIVRSREINRHGILASIAVLYYDYMLTFASEVELFWSRPCRNLPSFLFFLSRYSAILLHIPIGFEFFYFPMTYKQCCALEYFHRIYCFYAIALVTTLQTIRTYVFYDRSKKLLGGLLSVGAILTGVSCWAFVTSRRRSPPRQHPKAWNLAHTCVVPITKEQGHFYAIAWSSAAIYDTVIFVLTYIKYRRARQAQSNRVFDSMIRDGTIYFGFLAVLYSLVLYDLIVNQGVGETTTITNAIASALMSRLMLNLRALKNAREEFSNITTFSWVTVARNSMLSPINTPSYLSPVDDIYQTDRSDRDSSIVT